MSYTDPLTSIEISDVGDRIGRCIQVTVAATGRVILLPTSQIQFAHRRVILPVRLHKKLIKYLQPKPNGGMTCQ